MAMRHVALAVLTACTTSPVVTTPADLRVTRPDVAESADRVSAFAESLSPLRIAFTASPPHTECHAAGPVLARLTVLISDLPPLVDGPRPSTIAIDLAVIAPWWPRSAAQLDLVPQTREPVGTLYPADDEALSGRLDADALTLDASTPLHITASYAIDSACDP
jgi:hypothetical protein